MVLFVFLSLPLLFQSYLIKNLIEVFDSVSTIEALTTLPSRIGICFYSLVNPLINWGEQSNLFSQTSLVPTIG